MQYLDKAGWPIEMVKGRWFRNFLRRLIHTRKLKRGTWQDRKIVPDEHVDSQTVPDKVEPQLGSRVRDRSPQSRETRRRS